MIEDPISKFMNRDVLMGGPETPLSEVVACMRSRTLSYFIVCEDRQPVGVLTERDAVAVLDRFFTDRNFEDVRACEIMASPVHTLGEESTMGEVMRVMEERRFRRVPIVDDAGEITGIVNLEELQAAMNAVLERRGRDLEFAVMERTVELQVANAKLEELSISDGLTGLLNRRAMNEKLENVHDVSRRYGNEYAVALIDIDHFKNFNDALGHVAGDEAIRTVARILQASVRTSDTVYRYGGEEFLIVMPETSGESVDLVADRIRSAIEAHGMPHPKSTAGPVLTVSVGHTSVTRDSIDRFSSWGEVVEEADRALYRAKKNGRNTVAGSDFAT